MPHRKEPTFAIAWRQPDGAPVSCEAKLDVLNENLAEIREYCQDAFEDAILMGCDEAQVREVFAAIVRAIENPYRDRKR
jgi:hypothetical protein